MKENERLTTATYKHMTDKYKTATKKCPYLSYGPASHIIMELSAGFIISFDGIYNQILALFCDFYHTFKCIKSATHLYVFTSPGNTGCP